MVSSMKYAQLIRRQKSGTPKLESARYSVLRLFNIPSVWIRYESLKDRFNAALGNHLTRLVCLSCVSQRFCRANLEAELLTRAEPKRDSQANQDLLRLLEAVDVF